MTLSKRLATIEARLGRLEQWQGEVIHAIEEEEHEDPTLTLDGEYVPGERNQDEPL